MLNKDIIYPVFLECCKFCEDDCFWVSIFEDLAYGKPPYGVYISKNFLCCGYKNKEFSYKIEKKPPKQLYDEVYLLFTTRLGLLSNQQKIQQKLELTNLENKLAKERSDNWMSIRKTKIKDLLIELYVIDMKKKHSLSMKQAKYLLSLIFMAIIFKVITAKDIEYSDGEIKNIKGIEFKHKEIILVRDIYVRNDNGAPDIVIEKNSLSDVWIKHVKELQKTIMA